MAITAIPGPFVQYGITLSSTSGDGITGADYEHNSQRAPMLTDMGDAMLDPRVAYAYAPGAGVTAQSVGFFNNTALIDYVPATANTSAFQATATGSSGVSTFVLAAASSANGTFSTTIIAPETGKVTGTLIAIDSTAATLAFGTDKTILLWNPAGGTGRNIVIKPSSNLDGGSYTIAGRDMYGYKMTESVAAGSTSLAGKKAFKYVSSITNASAPTSTGISIGFGDILGFPLQVPYVGINAQVSINSSANNSSPTSLSTTTVVLASTAATQTSSTPDVRGTYSSSTASNGVIRVQMLVMPTAQAIATVTSTNVSGLFGGTQFSSV